MKEMGSKNEFHAGEENGGALPPLMNPNNPSFGENNNNNMFKLDDNSFYVKDREVEKQRKKSAQQLQDEEDNIEMMMDIDDKQYTTLESLSDACKSLGKYCNRFLLLLQLCSARVENAMKCKVQMTVTFIFVVFFFVAVAVGFILLTSDAQDLSAPPAFDSLKKYIASKLVPGALIFTFYGIIFLQISHPLMLIALFLVQAVPALFVFLYQCYVL